MSIRRSRRSSIARIASRSFARLATRLRRRPSTLVEARARSRRGWRNSVAESRRPTQVTGVRSAKAVALNGAQDGGDAPNDQGAPPKPRVQAERVPWPALSFSSSRSSMSPTLSFRSPAFSFRSSTASPAFSLASPRGRAAVAQHLPRSADPPPGSHIYLTRCGERSTHRCCPATPDSACRRPRSDLSACRTSRVAPPCTSTARPATAG